MLNEENNVLLTNDLQLVVSIRGREADILENDPEYHDKLLQTTSHLSSFAQHQNCRPEF